MISCSYEVAYKLKLNKNDIDDLLTYNKTIWVKKENLLELKLVYYGNYSYIKVINHTHYSIDLYIWEVSPVILKTKVYTIEDKYNDYLILYFL